MNAKRIPTYPMMLLCQNHFNIYLGIAKSNEGITSFLSIDPEKMKREFNHITCCLDEHKPALLEIDR